MAGFPRTAQELVPSPLLGRVPSPLLVVPSQLVARARALNPPLGQALNPLLGQVRNPPLGLARSLPLI